MALGEERRAAQQRAAPAATTAAGWPARPSPDRLLAEHGDQPLAHRLHIDPHSPQRTGVIGARARHQPGRGKPLQLGAGAGKIQAMPPQQGRRPAGLPPEQA
jgi:hypothetical protein